MRCRNGTYSSSECRSHLSSPPHPTGPAHHRGATSPSSAGPGGGRLSCPQNIGRPPPPGPLCPYLLSVQDSYGVTATPPPLSPQFWVLACDSPWGCISGSLGILVGSRSQCRTLPWSGWLTEPAALTALLPQSLAEAHSSPSTGAQGHLGGHTLVSLAQQPRAGPCSQSGTLHPSCEPWSRSRASGESGSPGAWVS